MQTVRTISASNSRGADYFNSDEWLFSDLGVAIDPTKSNYKLTFSGISQSWLKNLAKKFIHVMAATKTYGALENYLSAIIKFSDTLSSIDIGVSVEALTRNVMATHFSNLKRSGLAAATRQKRILNLKFFFDICDREGWLKINTDSLIFKEDVPRPPKAQPRFIPESVMLQLNENIGLLDESTMRIVLIIQEVGMRISELLLLPKDCLIQDSDGDYFLQTHQRKLNKDHTVPVSNEVVLVIQEQIAFANSLFGNSNRHLFPMPPMLLSGKSNPDSGKPFKTKTIINRLNALAKKAEIKINGEIYHFTTHKFRHTVGTRMINNGVPQHIVQRYLGHESPCMTSTYAHVMDSTMKREFAKFKGEMVDVAGNIVDEESIARDISQGADNVDAQWLKRHISAQALPNGLCAMPVVQSCDKANACLTCGNFRTDARYLDQHKEQLERTCSILDTAKQNGWTRQIEMNEKLKQNLLNIIEPLESQNDA